MRLFHLTTESGPPHLILVCTYQPVEEKQWVMKGSLQNYNTLGFSMPMLYVHCFREELILHIFYAWSFAPLWFAVLYNDNCKVMSSQFSRPFNNLLDSRNFISKLLDICMNMLTLSLVTLPVSLILTICINFI